MAVINVDGVKLMTLEEIKQSKGAGWAELYFEADEEEGTPEYKELVHCAWCRGNVIYGDGNFSNREYLEHWYNRQYGERIWTGDREPTEEEREAEPWTRNDSVSQPSQP